MLSANFKLVSVAFKPTTTTPIMRAATDVMCVFGYKRRIEARYWSVTQVYLRSHGTTRVDEHNAHECLMTRGISVLAEDNYFLFTKT